MNNQRPLGNFFGQFAVLSLILIFTSLSETHALSDPSYTPPKDGPCAGQGFDITEECGQCIDACNADLWKCEEDEVDKCFEGEDAPCDDTQPSSVAASSASGGGYDFDPSVELTQTCDECTEEASEYCEIFYGPDAEACVNKCYLDVDDDVCVSEC